MHKLNNSTNVLWLFVSKCWDHHILMLLAVSMLWQYSTMIRENISKLNCSTNVLWLSASRH